MSNNMTHGFPCGYRMDDIVHHLSAVFESHRALPHASWISSELVVHYEMPGSATPKAAARKLLDYLGLPFESCLRAPTAQRAPSIAINTTRSISNRMPGVCERMMQAFGYRMTCASAAICAGARPDRPAAARHRHPTACRECHVDVRVYAR